MIRDLKESFASLIRSPGFSAIVILTIALATGATTSLYSVLDGVLLRPLPYAEPGDLVLVWESNPSQGQEESVTSLATYVDWRERSRGLESLGAYQYRGFTLTGDGDPVRVPSVEATPDLFKVLGVAPAMGRVFTAEDEIPGSEFQLILSHQSWLERFGGDPGVIGNTLVLDGQGFQVVGVMPAGFEFPAGDPDVEIWSPLTLSLENLPSRPHRSYEVVARLAGNTTLDQVRAEMAGIAADIARDFPDSNDGWTVRINPLHEQVVGEVRSTLWILFAAVLLVFFIGCVNVSNLLAVRGVEGARGFAVRAALGAGRMALMRRATADSLLLTLAGGIAGIGVAMGGVRLMKAVIPPTIPRLHEVTLDLRVVGFALALTLVTGLLVGLVPAIRAGRPQISILLQDGSRGGSTSRASRRLWGLLVAGEVALVLVLVVGSGLMVRSFSLLTAVDPGFRTEGVLSVAVALPASRYPFGQQGRFYADLAERISALPGVESSGGVSALPMSAVGSEFKMPFTVEGLDAVSPSERPQADFRAVVPGYFATLEIDLLDGRVFDALDGTDERPVAIVNRSLAERYFPNRSPLGQNLAMPMAGTLEVVGVVEDVRHGGLQSLGKPELFVPANQLALDEMHFVVRSSVVGPALVRSIREAILALDPALPPTQVATLEELVSTSVAGPRFNMILLTGLAVVALLLAGVGVFGVVSYTVALRTGEIGLRMALGADPARAMRLVLMQTLRSVSLGVAVGLGGAALLSRYLESLLYGVAPMDPVTYLAGAGTGVALGLIAALWPALRAARLDPVEALRTD